MKKIFSISIIAALLFAVLSCNGKSGETQKTEKENSTANTDDKQKPNTGSPNIPDDIKDILGEWTLIRRLRDDNGNHKIDEEEEKTVIPGVKSYMKLNADGTCKFETVMDGTYEIVIEEDGRKKVAIKDLQGTKYPIDLYIVSVNENELVINTYSGGSGFDIFKRP